MESRSAWTDERLDDRFDHVDRELSALRTELREGFSAGNGRIDTLGSDLRAELAAFRSEVGSELTSVRSELGSDISALRSELNDLRGIMIRSNAAMVIGLLGVIAAIFARGA